MELIDLSVRDFRNLSGQIFAFGEATNAILGANGAGKTSLLEAMVVLGNLRSFRTTSLRRAVRHNENSFSLVGTVSSAGRTHRVTVDQNSASRWCDGQYREIPPAFSGLRNHRSRSRTGYRRAGRSAVDA